MKFQMRVFTIFIWLLVTLLVVIGCTEDNSADNLQPSSDVSATATTEVEFRQNETMSELLITFGETRDVSASCDMLPATFFEGSVALDMELWHEMTSTKDIEVQIQSPYSSVISRYVLHYAGNLQLDVLNFPASGAPMTTSKANLSNRSGLLVPVAASFANDLGTNTVVMKGPIVFAVCENTRLFVNATYKDLTVTSIEVPTGIPEEWFDQG